MFAYRPPPCISTDGSVAITTNVYDQADLSVVAGGVVAGQNISVTNGNTVSTTNILSNIDAVQFLDSASIESNSGQLVLHGPVTSGNRILLNGDTHAPLLTVDTPGLLGTPLVYRQLLNPDTLIQQPVIQYGTVVLGSEITSSQPFTFHPYTTNQSYISFATPNNLVTLQCCVTNTSNSSATITWAGNVNPGSNPPAAPTNTTVDWMTVGI